MCGIVGIAGRFSKERLTSVIGAMNAAVSHRGPDDEGSWVGENFAFGMRRLSIIDLAGGHQPMWDSLTDTGIVYNGEVYNYRTVRAALEKLGISFTTSSDTEVVLKGLAMKGREAVHDWNGMFAVAQWDVRNKKLLLIRDRIGVKPLYYFWNGSTFLFASEIKALLAANVFSPELNQQAVWDYLTFRYVPGPETMWRNIWKLQPGHMLEWSPDRSPRVTRYWKTDVVSDDGPVDIERKTKEFEELFLDSVEQRLLASDVPVGVMLSGGLDSSSVAAAAVELGHKKFHTFSVGFAEGGRFSELSYARQVAGHLGIECHEVVVDRSSFLEMLPSVVWTADEPLGDLTTVPLLAVSKLAREHVKVVLSGEGADEILAGYQLEDFHRKIQGMKRIHRLPSWPTKLFAKTLRPLSPDRADKLLRIANTPLSKWNIVNKNHMTRVWSEFDKATLWAAFPGRDSDSILSDMYSTAGSADPLDQLLAVYQQSWLVEDLLMKADKMSMAASLELRVPFLDYRLVEWANRQPAAVKIGRLEGRPVTKYVLRRFAQKRLPREIIDRPKQGFPVSVYGWFEDEKFGSWTREHLTGRQSKLKDLFAVNEIEEQLRRSARGDQTASHRTWLLIVLETWLREFKLDVEPSVASRSEPFVAPSP